MIIEFDAQINASTARLSSLTPDENVLNTCIERESILMYCREHDIAAVFQPAHPAGLQCFAASTKTTAKTTTKTV